MFTENFTTAFQPLQLSAENVETLILHDILRAVFMPQSPFNPPPTNTDFNLERPEGLPINSILSEVYSKVVVHSINTRHILALAHMVPPPSTISVIADLIIGAMNQCAFIWEESPLASTLETEVITWLLKRVGFRGHSTGLLTSGGTMSNCLATYLALSRGRCQVEPDKKKFCIIASDQAHFSVEKAAALVGGGSISVNRIKTDSQGRLYHGQVMAEAEQAIKRGTIPFLFICTAGTTNAGTVEKLDEFLIAARTYNAWCHIDAAHGGMVTLCDNSTSFIAQWKNADSISWDPHKSLFVSYATGALLLKDIKMREPLQFGSDYALKGDNLDDAGLWHIDSSRRFEALKLWMTINYFGLNGFKNMINHSLQLAQEFARQIQATKDFVLITKPDTNIVCFRFVDLNLREDGLDFINISLQKQLFITDGPLISTTKIDGRIALRAVLINPMLGMNHLKNIVELIQAEAHHQLSLYCEKCSLKNDKAVDG